MKSKIAIPEVFITGTDTNVGKTLVACALLVQAQNQGLKSLGLKPLAAGVVQNNQQPQNEDALFLQKYSSVQLAYEDVNPVVLTEAIAPHIAADLENKKLSAKHLAYSLSLVDTTNVDFIVVEGAGGWLVPLNEKQTTEDMAKALNIPVILVVAMRLGCLNHALLSMRAIESSGLATCGWVATVPMPMPYLEENISYLKQSLAAPCLGVIPLLSIDADLKMPDPIQVAQYLSLP